MSPERQAAECIARAVATNPKEECVHFRPESGECARRAFPCTCAEDGRRGVEAISAVGLVLMTAQRAAELLEAEEALAAALQGKSAAAAGASEMRERAAEAALDSWLLRAGNDELTLEGRASRGTRRIVAQNIRALPLPADADAALARVRAQVWEEAARLCEEKAATYRAEATRCMAAARGAADAETRDSWLRSACHAEGAAGECETLAAALRERARQEASDA